MNKIVCFLINILILSFLITVFSITAFAGQWFSIGQDWYYMTDDGYVAKNTWLWLDENRDGKAECYHFDEKGVMSKSTGVYYKCSYCNDDTVFHFDENGALISNYDGNIYSVNIPPYSINIKNGTYVYSLKNNDSHYNFIENDHAYTDELIDCGGFYSSNIDIIVFHSGSDPGPYEVMECYIPATAYFSKDCMVKHYPSDSTEIPISNFYLQYKHYNYLIVNSIDSNGYITACTLMGVE